MAYGVIPAGKSVLDGSARLREDLEDQAPLLPKTAPRVANGTGGHNGPVEEGPSAFSRPYVYPFHTAAGGAAASDGPGSGPTGQPPSDPNGNPVQPPSYESLDYEEYDDTVFRADQAASSSLDALLFSANKYLVCFAIGVLTAVAAVLVNYGVENISGLKFWATLQLLSQGHVLGSFAGYAAMNAALVAASAAITLWVGPAAAGSGIAEVKAYLNGVDVPYIFHFNTLVAKVLGAVGSVAGGLAIGKEGPFVHAGAAIAAIVSQGGSGSYRLGLMRGFWNDRDRYDLVACGAAAGVAAAFRSPVGGVLFALEEMTSWWKNQMLWLAFFTTAVVSVSIRVIMKRCWKQNGCGFFGSGGFIYFEIEEGQDTYEFFELLPMLLLGVLGGLLGSGLIAMNARLAEWRKRHLAPLGRRGRMLEVVAISLLTSALSFGVPLMVQCRACPSGTEEECPRTDNLHSGNFVNFACRFPGTYNDLATLFFNTQDDAIRNLFSSKTQREYTVSALLLFAAIFYGLATLTYGVSCPTGLFVPSILCGAAYGRLVGIFVADMHPGHYIDEGTYALLGAASFLGGAMRLTVCTCVMLLELTNNLALLPLIMLVLLVAKAVGDGTGVRPIYEVATATKGLPFLQPQPEPFMRHITAKECCGHPPVTFNRVEKVRSIVETLRRCGHNGFPVMGRGPDGERIICGVVLRQQLLTLLATGGRSMQASPTPTDNTGKTALSYTASEFSKPMSDPAPGPHDGVLAPGALGEDSLERYLDLGPFLNTSYHVVQEDAPLSKVYQLLRTLGLRHICVVPRAHEVVGMITRADLLPDALERKYSRMPGHYTTDGLNIVAHTGPTGGGGSSDPSASGAGASGSGAAGGTAGGANGVANGPGMAHGAGAGGAGGKGDGAGGRVAVHMGGGGVVSIKLGRATEAAAGAGGGQWTSFGAFLARRAAAAAAVSSGGAGGGGSPGPGGSVLIEDSIPETGAEAAATGAASGGAASANLSRRNGRPPGLASSGSFSGGTGSGAGGAVQMGAFPT